MTAQPTTPRPTSPRPTAPPPTPALARAALPPGRTAEQLLAVALRSRHDAALGALADAAALGRDPAQLVPRLGDGLALPARALVPGRTLPFTVALATAWAGAARSPEELVAAVEVYRQVLEAHGPRGLRRLEQRHYLQAAFLAGRHDLVRAGLSALDGVSADVTAGLRADLADPHLDASLPVTDRQPADHDVWVELFGERFAARGLAGPLVDPAEETPFDGLHLAAGRSVDGPLVTVVMPVWRPGRGLVTSVRSVLAQTHGHLEVLLVDDASGQEFDALFEECAALDERVRLVRQPVNGGSYVARNTALGLARGDLVTTQDADDWSHPERIAEQVALLAERPEAAASRSVAIRCRPDLTRQWFGYRPERMNASSLLVRREIFDRLGPFDRLRKGADSEIHERLRLVGGVVDVVKPLAVTRLAGGSLSRADFSWGWHHPDRVLFRSSFRDWHRRLAEGEESLPLRREGRLPYAVPRAFVRALPDEEEAPRTAYPLVLLADAADPLPEGAGVTLDALAAGPERLAVLAREDLTRARAEQADHAPDLLRAAREARVDLLTDPDDVRAGSLLVLEPGLLALPARPLPRLRADRVVVAAVPPGRGEPPRDLEAAGDTARELSGRAPVWVARTRAEQEVWRADGWGLPLLGDVLGLVP